MRIKEALFEILYKDKHISTEEDYIFAGTTGRSLKNYIYGESDTACNEVKLMQYIQYTGCELIIRKGNTEYKIDGVKQFHPREEEADREVKSWLKAEVKHG